MALQRRLSDKIIEAHQLALAAGKLDVAELLLNALQVDLSAIGGDQVVEHREATEALEAAFARHRRATNAR